MRLSERQWQLLSAVTFGVYGTGQIFAERPKYELKENILTIQIESTEKFHNYTRRAFAIMASRLVAFTVDSIQAKYVKCSALFNHTPPLDIDSAIIDMILENKQ